MTELLWPFVPAVPFLIIGAVVAGQMVMRARLAPIAQKMRRDLRCAAIAERLGLVLIEGDPNFVFIQMGAVRTAHRRIVMRGNVEGYPLELVYEYRRTHESDFTDVLVRTTFDCRLSSEAREVFPPFEVLSRHRGRIVCRQPLLPESPTGDSDVDATYLVRTSERRLAALLGPLLRTAHATLGPIGIHLSGEGQRVSFVMHEKSAPHPGEVLQHAEAAAALLLQVTRAVGG